MRRITLVLAVAASLSVGCTAFKRCAYESPGRDDWQHPDRVVAALGIVPGQVVADVGAGSGYFTERLARAVGPDGTVYAVDVDAAMNQEFAQRVRAAGLENVRVVLGEYHDPLLPDAGVDLVFSANTYHHIEDRVAYFGNLKRDLATGGRVALIDYDGSHGWFVRIAGHAVGKDIVLREMQAAGYQLLADHPFLPRQSFLLFHPTN